MKPAYYETTEYSAHLHRIGASITRKRDNTSVYFQAGDATEDFVTSISHCLTHENAEIWFNDWCDNFTEQFDAHAMFHGLTFPPSRVTP